MPDQALHFRGYITHHGHGQTSILHCQLAAGQVFRIDAYVQSHHVPRTTLLCSEISRQTTLSNLWIHNKQCDTCPDAYSPFIPVAIIIVLSLGRKQQCLPESPIRLQ